LTESAKTASETYNNFTETYNDFNKNVLPTVGIIKWYLRVISAIIAIFYG
jgi:hypothetical protein